MPALTGSPSWPLPQGRQSEVSFHGRRFTTILFPLVGRMDCSPPGELDVDAIQRIPHSQGPRYILSGWCLIKMRQSVDLGLPRLQRQLRPLAASGMSNLWTQFGSSGSDIVCGRDRWQSTLLSGIYLPVNKDADGSRLEKAASRAKIASVRNQACCFPSSHKARDFTPHLGSVSLV